MGYCGLCDQHYQNKYDHAQNCKKVGRNGKTFDDLVFEEDMINEIIEKGGGNISKLDDKDLKKIEELQF